MKEDGARDTFETLLGRDAEWSELRRALDDAAAGRGAVLRLVGEPGVGKTALVRALARSATDDGIRLLTTRGSANEQHLTFSAVHRLVEPIRTRVAQLSPGHRRSMNAAFGLEPNGRVPERFFVALATLELLTRQSSSELLLVLVDDRHWLDPASRDILDFVARRIAHERVALISTERPTAEPVDRDEPGRTLFLRALDPQAASLLLDRTAPDLSLTSRGSILDAANGNPLALVELPTESTFAPAQDRDRSPSRDRRLDEVFGARVGALPRQVRAALLIAALQDGDAVSETLAAVDHLATGRSALDLLHEAEVAGLLRIDAESVRFRHPLVRAAVINRSDDGDRRSAHEALASALVETPKRAEWHRGSSLSAPGEADAERLGAVAERGADRGDAAFARALFDKAVRLSTDSRRRSHRLLRVAELAFELGSWDEIKPITLSIREDDLSPVDRARLVGLEMAFDDGVPDGAAAVRRFVSSARDAVRAGDDRLAAGLLVIAARNTYWGATADRLAPEIRQATSALGDDGPVRALVVVIDSITRPFESAPMIMAQLAELAKLDLDDETVALFSQAGYSIGDFDRSLRLAQRSCEGLRRDGRLALLTAALVLQSFSALWLGRWDLTYTASAEAFQLGVETRQPVWAACARLGQANLFALRGRREEAEAVAAEVERTAVTSGNAALMNGVQLSRGLAALGADDPAAAYTQLARMFDRNDFAWQSPQCVWAVDYLAESAIASGQREAARSLLLELRTVTTGSTAPGVLRAMTLAELLLADDADAEPRYEQAAAVPATPWHRARRDLAHGAWLRRHRDTTTARTLLNSAAAIFEALDAPAWAARAANELAATGARRTVRSLPAPWSRLTAQELQVALMASEGLTNREIGARLYLSSRTISSHLYRIYPKLGVTSRTQLHIALRGAQADA